MAKGTLHWEISTCQGCPDQRSFASRYVQILPRNDCSTSRRRCPTGLLAAQKGGLLRKHVIDEQNATAVDIVNLLRIRLDSPILDDLRSKAGPASLKLDFWFHRFWLRFQKIAKNRQSLNLWDALDIFMTYQEVWSLQCFFCLRLRLREGRSQVVQPRVGIGHGKKHMASKGIPPAWAVFLLHIFLIFNERKWRIALVWLFRWV